MSESDPFVGQTLGRFEIVEKIGQGGMGVVYRGRQMSLNRPVAIKILPRQMAMDEEFVQRFRQEAEVIAGLAHENMVYVYDIDQLEGCYYIVMEYVDGTNLRQLQGGRPMAPDQVRAIGIPVARALEHAHQRGIIHRDVKSSNVMVTREGRVKLMDFGIAKAAGSGVKTVTGSILGTPEYMAPEQARTGRVTVQSDVYSLGVMLYELACGRLPFYADDPFAIALKHVSEEPTAPRHLVPTIPEWLEAVILRAMAKDPSRRHGSAAELELDLQRAGHAHGAEAPTLARPQGGDWEATLPLTPGVAAPAVAAPAVAIHAAPTPSTPPFQLPTGAGRPPGNTTPLPVAPPVPPSYATPPPPPPPPAAPGTGPTHRDAAFDTGAPAAAATARRFPWLAATLTLAAVLAVILLLLLGGEEQAPERVAASAAAPVGGAPLGGTPPERASGLGIGEREKRQLTIEVRIDEAETLLDAGDAAGALGILDEVLREHPDHPRARALRHRAAEAAGASSDAAPRPAETAGAGPAIAALPPPSPIAAPPVAEPITPTIRPVAPPPSGPGAAELWAEARQLREAERYHSLRDTLDRLLAIDGGHSEARSWRGDVDGWIHDQTESLEDEVADHLEELADGIGDQDLDDVVDLWEPGQRGGARAVLGPLFERAAALRASFTPGPIEVRDGVARFAASFRIEGKPERGRRAEWHTVRSGTWHGELTEDGFRRPLS